MFDGKARSPEGRNNELLTRRCLESGCQYDLLAHLHTERKEHLILRLFLFLLLVRFTNPYHHQTSGCNEQTHSKKEMLCEIECAPGDSIKAMTESECLSQNTRWAARKR